VFADGDDFECFACGCKTAGTSYVHYGTDFLHLIELLGRSKY
jgi:hypothetical protein